MSLRRAALVALALTSTAAVLAPAYAQAPAPAAQGRRHGADADGDGRISLQEFLAARGRMFEHMDANHDGQVTSDEIAAFKAHMEAAAAGATIRSGREHEGGGHQLARFEQMAASGPVTRAQWDAMMTRRFQRLDTANTGFITMDQMHQRPGAAAAAMPAAAAPPPQR